MCMYLVCELLLATLPDMVCKVIALLVNRCGNGICARRWMRVPTSSYSAFGHMETMLCTSLMNSSSADMASDIDCLSSPVMLNACRRAPAHRGSGQDHDIYHATARADGNICQVDAKSKQRERFKHGKRCQPYLLRQVRSLSRFCVMLTCPHTFFKQAKEAGCGPRLGGAWHGRPQGEVLALAPHRPLQDLQPVYTQILHERMGQCSVRVAKSSYRYPAVIAGH